MNLICLAKGHDRAVVKGAGPYCKRCGKWIK